MGSYSRRIDVKRVWYIARKYFRMNPFRHWWILHVWDELRSQWDDPTGHLSGVEDYEPLWMDLLIAGVILFTAVCSAIMIARVVLGLLNIW